MSLPPSTDVLIVGAGPTGLACAVSLLKEGCKNITIVDGVTQGENTSRAFIVHAATLEALDSIGCAQSLIQAGRPSTSVSFWLGSRFHQTADFGSLAPYTKYACVLGIPQHCTESILVEKLRKQGVSVVRPNRVTGMHASEVDSQCTDVVFEDGQVVRARCVIGADGARSTVRASAGIAFADPDGQSTEDSLRMVLADVTFTRQPTIPDSAIIFLLMSNAGMLLAPLPLSPGDIEQVYRIGIILPRELGDPPQNPSIEYLQSLIDARGFARATSTTGEPLTLARTLWATRFRTRSAIADTFFARVGGPVLLVGDAAHIHPPAGGQGMNLGLRDAVRLGPAVAAYIAATEADADADGGLQQWAAQRHACALTVIAFTKRTMGAVTAKDETTWVLGFIPVNLAKLRNFVMGTLARFHWARSFSAWKLSGLEFR